MLSFLPVLTGWEGIMMRRLRGGPISLKKQTDIVILDLPILDTRSKACGVLGRFITDLIVQIMAYLADAERKKNKEAKRAGIEAKKARGEWGEYGRPRSVTEEKFKIYYRKVKKGEMTVEEVVEELQISVTTYNRYVKKIEER